MDVCTYLHVLWSGPFQIIVSLILLFGILSWATLFGFAIMILLLPTNAWASRLVPFPLLSSLPLSFLIREKQDLKNKKTNDRPYRRESSLDKRDFAGNQSRIVLSLSSLSSKLSTSTKINRISKTPRSNFTLTKVSLCKKSLQFETKSCMS